MKHVDVTSGNVCGITGAEVSQLISRNDAQLRFYPGLDSFI